MADNVIQHSFAAGEMAPSLLARTDLPKYKSGAAVMRNFFVDYRSGTSTRSGFQFMNFGGTNAGPIRLIPFQFNSKLSFAIEFGQGYCRFYYMGALVLENPYDIFSVFNQNPLTIEVGAGGTNFNVNDWVYISGVNGATPVNNRVYIVTSIISNEITLEMPYVGNVDSTNWPPYISGGTIGRVYTLPSPYNAADVGMLKFAQIANIMTITHGSYPPHQLICHSANNWEFTQINYGTTMESPTWVQGFSSAGGNANYAYVVTAVDANGQESLPSAVMYLNNEVDMTTTQGSNYIEWNPATDIYGNPPQGYNVYKAAQSYSPIGVQPGAAFGFVSSVTGTAFTDTNFVPDFSQSIPIQQNPFANGNYPSVIMFCQQRAYYAASYAYPTTFWASQPGSYSNFDKSDPTVDSDAIQGTLVSLQMNEIKSMIPMPGGLVILTSSGAWLLSGTGSPRGLAEAAAITPQNATATPQAYQGASDLPPIPINYDILYVQSKSSIVRDLSYNIYANIYTGADVSVLASHLVFNHQIMEWAYCEEPFKVVWMVREDGILLSLTFVREQEMIGWARHDTYEGVFKSVCSIREGNHDVVYAVVWRNFSYGWAIPCIERMKERTLEYGADGAFSVDCAVETGLWAPSLGIYVWWDSGVANEGTGITFYSTGDVFLAGWVGNVKLRVGGGVCMLDTYTSATQMHGHWLQMPTGFNMDGQFFGVGLWTVAGMSNVFYGLDHLNGLKCSIVADGIVCPQQVVENGSITLPFAASKATVGLPFQAQLQTMYLDTGEPTTQGKRKAIPATTIRMLQTAGLKVGRTFETLTPLKMYSPPVPINEPIPLFTGDNYFIMDPLWETAGQLCFQVDDPMPATILGVIPSVTIGDTSEPMGKRGK